MGWILDSALFLWAMCLFLCNLCTVLVTVASPNVVWSQGEGDAYNLFSFLRVTLAEIIVFGSSRQPYYGSGSGGKRDRGSSELRESCPSVQRNWLIVLSVINTEDSSGLIRMGACMETPRHLHSWLLWESNPWDLCLWGQSIFQCDPLQTREPEAA